MAVLARDGRFDPEQLAQLREATGGGHVEIDASGLLIVAPPSWPHELACRSLVRALLPLEAHGLLVVQQLPWGFPDGALLVPDVGVIAAATEVDDGYGMTPPPPLVAEVASPSTRRRDRSEKLERYLAGGCAAVLLVDLPSVLPGLRAPALELLRAEGGRWVTVDQGPSVTVVVGGGEVVVDGAALERR